MKAKVEKSTLVTTTGEVDLLFANRLNLKNFHYYTNDENVYNHYCDIVASHFGIKEDPKVASNITNKELQALNRKYNLKLKSAYLNGPECKCGRNLNGYDFILNAIFRHGTGFLRSPKGGSAKFIMPFRRAMDSIVCSHCGELSPLKPRVWYRDSSDIDKYGPCCSND